MRNSQWLVVLCLCFAWGCANVDHVRVKRNPSEKLTERDARKLRDEAHDLGSRQPRTVERMTEAAESMEQVAHSLPKDYDAQWQAAEAWAFVAANHASKDTREKAAKMGLTIARHGMTLLPDRVECHYWYAINVGLLANADRTYGLKAVGEMETELKRAAELDNKYDYAGPLRILAILHLRTPAPPVSIGSPRKGLKLLQQAVELFPDYPENWLYLGEALKENNRGDEAQTYLKKVIDAKPWPDRQFESASWKEDAAKLMKTSASK